MLSWISERVYGRLKCCGQCDAGDDLGRARWGRDRAPPREQRRSAAVRLAGTARGVARLGPLPSDSLRALARPWPRAGQLQRRGVAPTARAPRAAEQRARVDRRAGTAGGARGAALRSQRQRLECTRGRRVLRGGGRGGVRNVRDARSEQGPADQLSYSANSRASVSTVHLL